MSLFVEPFNFSKYKEAKKAGKVFNSNLPTRLRELIIDLCEPRFRPSRDMYTMVDLLCPDSVDRNLYLGALDSLNIICEGKYSHMIRKDPDCAGSLLSDMQVTPAGVVTLGSLAFYPGCNPFELFLEYLALNQGQRDSIHKVLSAEDYMLILGLPGAGKTQTLSLIVRILIARNNRVLISSYTHAAVDNLMLKLRQAGIPPSIGRRIGTSGSIHPDIRAYSIDRGYKENQLNPIENIDSIMSSTRLIACTVLTTATSRYLSHFRPDWTIVDEAGQISQPAIIGALLKTKSFILVGDDYQLPPLVISNEAQAQGMNISLFTRLAEAHPSSVIILTAQYRMNQDIMTLCNEIIYENRMTCGNASIASAKFHLPVNDVLSRITASSPNAQWVEKCLGSEQSVVFLNTDYALFKGDDVNNEVAAEGRIDALSMSNEYEKEVILALIKCLVACDYKLENLGIISPYKSQVNLVQQAIGDYIDTSGNRKDIYHDKRFPCEISTVDKFQGRDMEMIIFSTVRSINDKSVRFPLLA